MKKFLFVVLFIPVLAFSQASYRHEVITKNGSVYLGDIESYLGKKINFKKTIKELGDNSIPIEDIVEIKGVMSKSRKKAILKHNPEVKFSELINEHIFSDKPIEFSEVVQLDDSFSRNVLFTNALNFVALEFRSANNVIQLKDKESGKIICKGLFEFSHHKYTYINGIIRFTLQIMVKDGRYKYIISGFTHESYDECYSFGLIDDKEVAQVSCADNLSVMTLPVTWKKAKAVTYPLMKKDCKGFSSQLITRLKESMQNSESDNW